MPYTPPAPQPERSKWTRKRVLIPAALMLFFIGVVAGSDGETESDTVASKKAAPAATVTATVTDTPAPAATVTATATATATATVKPEPAPTVTKTVHVTVAPAAGGSDDGSDDGSGSGGSAYYANCTAVRAADAAPIRTGDAGYGRHLDRDGDGVACE
ncbi:excalibur calcium-binding domain-containing protein [Streptomyces sp. Wb2n-11]|uniref:excalibur calcium-binding domain-containing protein n=1 Tax=Streptomyces sp. Wb2n-11 TaxID=1030533 RepID=UPI0021002AB2|nr:excalibur calcium-binding domain-containing protein [Streptomyces sp. Wb2n-11]